MEQHRVVRDVAIAIVGMEETVTTDEILQRKSEMRWDGMVWPAASCADFVWIAPPGWSATTLKQPPSPSTWPHWMAQACAYHFPSGSRATPPTSSSLCDTRPGRFTVAGLNGTNKPRDTHETATPCHARPKPNLCVALQYCS